jgi:L-serine dehydratase
MESIKEIFKIGNGPSSSHTMGPKRAIEDFLARHEGLTAVDVTLYGSLALTGKGHLTDYIIDQVLSDIPHTITMDKETPTAHPNTMLFVGRRGAQVIEERYISIGGGSIAREGAPVDVAREVYPHGTLTEIKAYCDAQGIDLCGYVYGHEGADIRAYLQTVADAMSASVARGLRTQGKLPGRLKIDRKAPRMFRAAEDLRAKLYAYAYAVAEENACGQTIVCAPTCGSSGVLPAVVRYSVEQLHLTDDAVVDGLAVAGLIGNLVKHNASISGAEAGCQAEVGTACAMAAAYYAYVRGMSNRHIEQAAEIALEHHLGLTCDPIFGYVQIPCIERNAVAAMRAVDAYDLAALLNPDDEKITFDMVCHTMLETGKDLTSLYRETARGGLAKLYNEE